MKTPKIKHVQKQMMERAREPLVNKGSTAFLNQKHMKDLSHF